MPPWNPLLTPFNKNIVIDLEKMDELRLEKIRPEIKQMVASGLDLKDIIALCQTSKKLNQDVCNNPHLYRALRVRDFGSWKYYKLPEEILPLELARRNDTWLDGVPVYWAANRAARKNKDYRELMRGGYAWKSAFLPGSGNTVRIHDQDYIWYYFLWAPKNHKQVNYNKKFTDEQIIEDLKLDLQLYGKARKIPTLEQSDTNAEGIFKLTRKRAQILCLNQGIVANWGSRRIVESLITLPKWDRESLIESGIVSAEDEVYFLDQIFTILRLNSWEKLLYPRAFVDPVLEYDLGFVSLALIASIDQPNLEAKQEKYSNLLEQFGIISQLAQFRDNFKNLEIGEITATRFFNILYHLIHVHEVGETVGRRTIFPQTPSFWPKELHRVILDIYTQLDDFMRSSRGPAQRELLRYVMENNQEDEGIAE